MKRSYTELDALLKSLISQGVSKFRDLERNEGLLTMATELNDGDSVTAFRVIDRRLQALRKKRVIEHDHFKGWVLCRE